MTGKGSLVGLVLGLVGVGCGAQSPICGSDFDAEHGVVGDFGSDMASAKVEAFLHATAALVIEVASVETRLRTACTRIATDLGVPASELASADVTVACHRAALEVRSAIETNLPTQATLSLIITPATCGVDIDAYASCVARCDVSVTGSADVTCTGGDVYGTCSGQCMGTCDGTCAAGCNGSCAATCTGSCSGTCFGACVGTCSATNAAGECVGTCSGTCTGTCQGMCQGSCSASCDGVCQGSCQGECHGKCDVAFTAPRCDGDVDVQASAECKSACEADVSFAVMCSPAEVAVEIAVDVPPARLAKLTALIATLEANYPEIVEISVAGSMRLRGAADAFVVSLRGAGAALDAGAHAAACTLEAVSAAVAASARIDVNVMATLEVGGSVSAQGMASAGP